jgi:asparagine synthase (glutamine-hydrolysing)
MCGIAGQINNTGAVDQFQFGKTIAALTHRGPDAAGAQWLDEGRVALGHRRLSIIDLSDAGLQPMANEDGTIWVTFNGEIYNYQSLRKELLAYNHQFRSRTDTEVIIHAYEQWGIGCVNRFRGIFAFGLWDGRARKLWLVRDQLGVKPLYYFHDGERLIFASEVKAIVANPSVPRRINSQAVCDYLTYGYVPFDRCIYEKMWKLPPGHFVEYADNKITVKKYWDIACTGEITDRREALIELQNALRESVSLQKISDVPLGVLLSGGIDSSAVTALLSHDSVQPIDSFTIGFEDKNHDETEHAQRVADLCQTLHQQRCLTFEAARRLIPLFSDVYDEPFQDTSGLPTYLLSQFAREKVKVVLSGDGGDEVFAGYKRYDRLIAAAGSRDASSLEWIFGRAAARPLRMASRGLPSLLGLAHRLTQAANDPLSEYFLRIGFFNRQDRNSVLSKEYASSEDDLWLLRRFWQADCDYVTAMQYLDLKTYLPDQILTKVDRASMAHGLEVRVPLLDHKLVELSFRISPNLLYSGGERKHLFKQSLAEMLPYDVLSRRKKGFGMPLDKWFNFGLRAQALSVLRDGSLVGRGILRPDFEGTLLEGSQDKVWILYVLEMWCRRWLESEPFEPAYLSLN